MIWFLFTILGTAAFAATLVLDNYYINKIFKKDLFSSVFYGHLLKAIIVLVFFLVAIRTIFPLKLLPFFIVVAACDIIYLFPYYKSLEKTDTSIIGALFSLGRIFVPILAFFTVNEILSPHQYFGFVAIIIASSLLTLHRKEKKFRFNKALLYMVIASIVLAIKAVTYKHILTHVDWITAFSWTFIFIGVATLTLLLGKNQRKAIVSNYTHFKKKYYVFFTNVALSLLGWATVTYAVSLADVSLVKGVEASEPFFVLLYAIVLKKFFPQVFKEHIDGKSVLKKSLLFLLVIAGILLIL